MKIERVELVLLELPYVHFFETSLGREERRKFILVKIFGDGICGYGEVVAERIPLYSYETTSTAWVVMKEYLIPLVFEKDIHHPQDFYKEAKRFKGHPMAKAGLELALWDVLGKEKEEPLWKLYEGTKKEIPSGVSVGIQDSVSQLLERIEGFLKEGYQRIKIKIKPEWDVRICEKVRERYPGIPLQVDANGAYSLADKQTLKKLDDFKLVMLEQPFPPPDLWDHSRLQKEIKTPLCLDESIASLHDAGKAHQMGSCRIINIKVGRVGGIVEARKIYGFCQKKSIPVWCGGMLESGIGRAHNIHLATLPYFRLPNDLSASRRYYDEDLIEPPVEITPQGTIKVPGGAGIGVFPVEKKIKKYTLHREVFRRTNY
ncbi:MAG: o-succinylbenzoate synthase [Candidatus Aminicenantes bacterium]